MSMSKLATLVALLAPLAVSSAAHADDWAVVSVNHCDEIAAAEPARAFRKALSQKGSTRIQSEADSARALGGRVGGSIEEAERLIQSARLDFIAASTDRAEAEIADATDLLASLTPSAKRWADYKEARTLAAWFYLHRGAREAAESAIREILEVDPDYRPNASAFPPKVGSLVQLLRAALKKAKTQELEVQTEPPGLPIYVGFKEAGVAPLKLKLPAGAYRVEALFPQGRGLPVRAELADERVVTVLKTSFHGAISTSRGPCVTSTGGRAQALGLLTQLATTLNAQRLVGVELDEPVPGEQYLAASLVDAAKGEEIRAARVKLVGGAGPNGAAHDLAEFIATGRAVQNMQIVSNPAADTAPVAAPAPRASAVEVAAPAVIRDGPARATPPARIGAYVAGGVGLAALAFGGVELAARNSAISDANSRFDAAHRGDAAAQSQFRDAIAKKDSATTLAAVGLGAGGAAVITSAVLFAISGSDQAPAVSLDCRDQFRGVLIAGRF